MYDTEDGPYRKGLEQMKIVSYVCSGDVVIPNLPKHSIKGWSDTRWTPNRTTRR